MDTKKVHERRWYILGVLVICLLVVILDNTILNVALKTIQQELGATQSQMEWAINSYTLVFAGLLFTWGVLGDRFGRKRLLLAGMLMFGAASALSAFSTSPGQLVATRALMGIGAAAVQPQTLSIITNVFEPRERGRAIGIWAGFSGLAIALGPVTGGFLLEHFWWGSIFLVNVPIVAVGVTAILLLVPESKDPAPKRIDPLGVALSIAGLVAFVYGIIKGGETTEWTSTQVLGPLLGGLALLAVFALVEARSSHPSLDVTLFRNPRFTAAGIAVAMAFFAMSGSTFYLSFYLQAVREYSPLKAGLLIVPSAAAIMLSAPRSAALVRRFGARIVVATGVFTVACALGFYVFVQNDSPLWMVEIGLVLMGLGMGNVMAPATESIMSAVPRDKAGAGSAVNNTVRQVGGALGVAILGSVMSSSYRGAIGSSVDVLPVRFRDSAGESIGGTMEAVGRTSEAVRHGTLPPEAAHGLPGLVDAARDSFAHAMHVTSVWSFAFAAVGAVVVAVFLPGRLVAGRRSDEQSAPGDTAPVADVVG